MSRTKHKKVINILIVAVILVAVFVVFFNFIKKEQKEYVYITFLCPIDNSKQIVKAENSYVLTEDIKPVEKEGYEFLGWFYDDDYKLEVVQGTVFNASHTVKACYSKILTKGQQSLESLIRNSEDFKYITVNTQAGSYLSLNELELIVKNNPKYLNLKNCVLETEEITQGMFNRDLEILYLPSNITQIKDNAFNGLSNSNYGAYNLSEIFLNDALLTIGDYAFYGLTNLKELKLNHNLTQIGAFALENSGLKSITINKNLEQIHQGVFKGIILENLKINSENVNFKLENNIIYTSDFKTVIYGAGYKQVTLTLNQNVERILNYAFYKNENLVSISFPSNIQSIGEYSFYNSNIKNVTFNDAKDYIIDKYAFAKCEKIERLEFQNGLKSIEGYAFSGCKKLNLVTFNLSTAIDVSQIESIKEGAFKNCTSLLSFVIPNSVNYLGEQTFADCTSLKTVVLSALIKDIKYKTFYNNHNLTSLVSSGTIESVGNYTFAECTKLNSAECLENITKLGIASFKNCLSLESVRFNNIDTLAEQCFLGCIKLKEVEFDKVKYIENQAFKDCSSLESFTFSSEISSIADHAFENSISLVNFVMPENNNFECVEGVIYSKDLKNLIHYPLAKTTSEFSIDKNLETIVCENLFINEYISDFVVAEDNLVFASKNGILFTKDFSKLIKYPNAKEATIIDFQTQVSVIGKCAFKNNKYITKIIFPSSVQTFERGCLEGMQKISALEIPFVGQSLTENRFLGHLFGSENYVSNANFVPLCLKSVKVTNDTKVEEYSFYDIDSIETLEFNKEVNTVSKYAFFGCLNLKNVIFNGKIEKICQFSFYNTESLTSITIGFYRDIEIEHYSFHNVKSSLLVYLHNNYQSINRYYRNEYVQKFINVYAKANYWQFLT